MKTETQIRENLKHVIKTIEAKERDGVYKNSLELSKLEAKKQTLDWILEI